ncbi:MAG: oligogalacturonate lyase family protein [Bacteroidota bacterium]
MGVGRLWKDQVFRYKDNHSGRWVTKLTDYKGHSNHLYFTNPCWLNNNTSFIFTSDRENASNLFRYDLPANTITQLTDLEGEERPEGYYSAVNNAHYFWYGKVLYELPLATLELRPVYEAGDDFVPRNTLSVTADGKYVCTLLQLADDVKPTGDAAIGFAYSRFVELFERKPMSRVVRIGIATGKLEVMHEDRHHMGHVNASPVLPNVLTFCHEGPWIRVDQRIWGLDIETGKVWKIRLQDEHLAIGHEYWLADGVTIGYHGRQRADQGRQFYGYTKWDNTERFEFDFPFHCTHFASNDRDLFVGDGTAHFPHPVYGRYAKPFIMLFKREGDRFVGPRILAYHRSTFNNQHAHPHPRFTPDGKYVMYSSDLTGYANIYLVEVGDFHDLPVLSTNDAP